MHCYTEEDCTNLVKLLPSTEAALLDWAINLMADVVENEKINKMNARNVAMVFAPNMTQVCKQYDAKMCHFVSSILLKQAIFLIGYSIIPKLKLIWLFYQATILELRNIISYFLGCFMSKHFPAYYILYWEVHL